MTEEAAGSDPNPKPPADETQGPAAAAPETPKKSDIPATKEAAQEAADELAVIIEDILKGNPEDLDSNNISAAVIEQAKELGAWLAPQQNEPKEKQTEDEISKLQAKLQADIAGFQKAHAALGSEAEETKNNICTAIAYVFIIAVSISTGTIAPASLELTAATFGLMSTAVDAITGVAKPAVGMITSRLLKKREADLTRNRSKTIAAQIVNKALEAAGSEISIEVPSPKRAVGR